MGLLGFLPAKIISAFIIWALLMVFIFKAHSTAVLLQVELIEEEHNIILSLDGRCHINGTSGYLLKNHFQSTWQRLTVELDIAQLTRSNINEDIKKQINNTGVVVIEDGAQLTTLKLTMDKEVRHIDIYGLLGLINSYPKSIYLSKVYTARSLLKEISSDCSMADN
jgi:hypothetical protein